MFNPTESTAHPEAFIAPARCAFGLESPNLPTLDAGLTRLEAAERLARRAEAERVAALAEIDLAGRLEAVSELGAKARARAAEDSLAYRAARAEAATAICLSEQAAGDHLARAATLTSGYPETIQTLTAGRISKQHAMVILEAGGVIGPVEFHGGAGADAASAPVDPVVLARVAANRALYEALVLVEAVKTTPNRLAPIARSIAERFALEDLDTRYERAKTTRRVWMTVFEDGLAEVVAVLPVHEATAVVSRLTQMAKIAVQVQDRTDREAREARKAQAAESSDPGENVGQEASPEPEPETPRRSRSEFMADLFTDLLLNGTGDSATGGPGAGITGVVQLITHEAHLNEPVEGCDGTAFGETARARDAGADVDRLPLPELEGYGPIPVGMACEIAAQEGVWSSVKVSLRTGNVLTVDRYQPSAEIRRFLAARDLRCRFPGCRVPIHRCDFDHTVDAALGGSTSTTNLGGLCRNHHLLKHHTGWATKQYENGDYEWTSPTGRVHVDEPVSRVTFAPVPAPKPGCEVDPMPEPVPMPEPGIRPEGTAPPETEHQGTAPSETEPLGEGLDDAHPF